MADWLVYHSRVFCLLSTAKAHTACCAHALLQAFMRQCIKDNSNADDVAMHWAYLAQLHAAGNSEFICSWVHGSLL